MDKSGKKKFGADSIEVTVNTTQGVQVHRLPY